MPTQERAGRYRILRPIAQGGMGAVYQATMTTLEGVEKQVALKLVRPDLSSSPSFVDAFVAEAKVIMLMSHANVVQAFDVGRLESQLFVAMELVDGVNLAALLQACQARSEVLPLRHSLLVAIEALKGLDYAHRRKGSDGRRLGLVHCDVSPSNLLISREGEVKIADFGIAQTALRTDFATDVGVRGKLPYMAPEQLRGSPVDLRADLYSLGATLYEMLTGQRMVADAVGHDGPKAVLEGRFPRPREVAPALSEDLEAIVLRAVETEPAHRFPSAAAMRQQLEELAVGGGHLLSAPDLADFVLDLAHVEDRPASSGMADQRGDGPPPASQDQPRQPHDSAPRPGARSIGGGFDALLGIELVGIDSADPVHVYVTSDVIGAVADDVASPALGGSRERVSDPCPSPEPAAPSPAPPLVRSTAIPAAPSGRSGQDAVEGRLGSRAGRWVWPLAIVVGVLVGALAFALVGGIRTGSTARPMPADPPRPGAAPAGRAAPAHGAASMGESSVPQHAVDGGQKQASSSSGHEDGGQDHRGDRAKAASQGDGPSRPKRSGEGREARPVPPEVEGATVSVNSVPWSRVFIDGQQVRATPVLGHGLPPGRHRITLRSPNGTVERELTIDLSPGEHRRLSIDLRPDHEQ